jgi:hypothetical protein
LEHNPRILELDQLPRALRNMEDMDEAQARRADKLAAGRRRALRLDALDPDTLELVRKEAETHGIVFLPGIAGSQGASPVVLVTDDESFKRLCVAFEARGERTLAASMRNTLAAYHRQGLGISFADGSRMDLDSAKVMGVLNVTPDSFSDGGGSPTPSPPSRPASGWPRTGPTSSTSAGRARVPAPPRWGTTRSCAASSP